MPFGWVTNMILAPWDAKFRAHYTALIPSIVGHSRVAIDCWTFSSFCRNSGYWTTSGIPSVTALQHVISHLAGRALTVSPRFSLHSVALLVVMNFHIFI
jgi:hypothetical protein